MNAKPPAAVVGVVLAGGAGSRLGQNKPTAELCGRPLIDYPLAAMQAAGLPVTMWAKHGVQLPELDRSPAVRAMIEPDQPRHPLRGIVSALEDSEVAVVFCACDMPFVTSELITWLVAQDDAPVVIPEHDGRLQPMLGRYSPQSLPAMRDALENETSVRDAVEAAGLRRVSPRELAQFGNPTRLLMDVDTPSDLEAAASLLRERH